MYATSDHVIADNASMMRRSENRPIVSIDTALMDFNQCALQYARQSYVIEPLQYSDFVPR